MEKDRKGGFVTRVKLSQFQLSGALAGDQQLQQSKVTCNDWQYYYICSNPTDIHTAHIFRYKLTY